MWETIKEVLTGENALGVLFYLTIMLFIFIPLIKNGSFLIKTHHVRIGREERERGIIRRQIEASHEFILSLTGKINADETKYGGYFSKYVLERVYDKAIEWIIFNHLSNDAIYVKDKQESICNLVYMLNPGEKYKTPEFKKRMCDWTAELIARLVNIREVYGNKKGHID